MTNLTPQVVLLVLIITAGCLDGYPGLSEEAPWTLNVNGLVTQDEGPTTFTGRVGLQGSTISPKEIRDIRVRFVGEHNETMRIVSIGTIDNSRPEVSINESFDRPPTYVLVYVEEVKGGGTEGNILGLVRCDDGYYDEYYEYDPFAKLSTTEEQS